MRNECSGPDVSRRTGRVLGAVLSAAVITACGGSRSLPVTDAGGTGAFAVAWVLQFGTWPTVGRPRVSVDPERRIFVAGDFADAPPTPNESDHARSYLARVSPSGELDYLDVLNATGVQVLSVDSSRVVIGFAGFHPATPMRCTGDDPPTCSHGHGATYAAWISTYSLDGRERSRPNVVDESPGREKVDWVGVASDGTVWGTARAIERARPLHQGRQEHVIQVRPDGSVTYHELPGDTNLWLAALSVRADGHGVLYRHGVSSSRAREHVLVRFGPAGEEIWNRPFPVTTGINELLLDETGEICALGDTRRSSPSAMDGPLILFDADGSPTGAPLRSLRGAARAAAMARDAQGRLYIAGTTDGDVAAPNRGGVDVWVARVRADGVLDAIVQLGDGGNDYVGDLVPDGYGGVYVVGTTDGRLSPEASGAVFVLHVRGGPR